MARAAKQPEVTKGCLCAEVESDGFSGTGHDLLHAGEGLAGLVHCCLDSGAKDRSAHDGGGADGVDDLSDAEFLIYIERFLCLTFDEAPVGNGKLVKVYAVESGGVFAHNLDLVLFGNVGEGALDDFPGVGEGAFVVGVVAAPHEARLRR